MAIAYVSVHNYPVVEKLGGDRHVEDIVAPVVWLVIQAQVQRDVKPLEYIVQLPGHHL